MQFGCKSSISLLGLSKVFLTRLGLSLLALLTFVLTTPSILYSEELSSEQRARFSEDKDPLGSLRFTPIELMGGSKLTLISPEKWQIVSGALSKSLVATHQKYSKLFGTLPQVNTAIRLMDEEAFFEMTGAPRWTNAMFFRGQIIIPLPEGGSVDMDNLSRSIKHEYTHAVINAMSAGRAPGWLDEGIAQWAEGSENPALRPALKSWLSNSAPVPLRLLQGGFTRLDTSMVPAAYAQSLYGAYAVMNTYGFTGIRKYFESLRQGDSKTAAFQNGFGVDEVTFEKRLGISLKRWAEENSHHGELEHAH